MQTKYFVIQFFLVLLSSSFSYGQDTYLLNGKVLDKEISDVLPGATIKNLSNGTGVVSDYEGDFQIEVSAEDTLFVSFVGFTSVTLPVQGRSVVEVEMGLDIQSLDEVIVTGYGEILKSDLTGAVSSVDMEDLSSLPVSGISSALQGRVAGVQVTPNSGAPGEPITIRIRGVGSINSGSDPLYVVDGVIVDDISYLAQSDIKSVEVMKDASVASLYGARAANGVIVVTTKQGTEGSMRVNVASQYGVQSFWNKPEMMNAEEYLYMTDGLLNGGNVEDFVLLQNNTLNDDNLPDNNWLDLLSREGTRQQHAISVSGGKDNVSYRVSSNIYQEDGIIINSDFQRVNVLGDISFKPIEKVKIRANFLYSDRDRNVQASGAWGILRRAVIDAPTKSIINSVTGLENDTPLFKAERNVDKRDESNTQVKLFLDYEITENLKFTSRYGFDKGTTDRFRYERPGVTSAVTLSPGTTGNIIQNSDGQFKWSWDQILSYNKKSRNYTLSLTGAFSMEHQSNFDLQSQGRSPLGNDLDYAYLVNASRNFVVDSDASEWSQLGGVFRSNYSFKHKYILQLNMRADGSSRFAESNRWGYFPSASFAWVFSDDLFSRSNTITNGKLRLSYGLLGNNRIGQYESYTIVSNTDSYAYGVDGDYNYYSSYAPSSLGNETISWEKTSTYNVGIDLQLGDNLFVTSDVFRKVTTDMLLRVPVPNSTGLINNPRRNVGEVTNDGIELVLTYKAGTENWNFDISGNATYLVNRVQNLGETNDPIFGGTVSDGLPVDLGFVTKTVVGRPIGSFYGYVVDRIDENGFFEFKDLNNDGLFTSDDRTFLGSPIPDLTYGLSVNLGYKSFDLAAQVQGVYGNEVFNALRYHTHGYNGTNALSGVTTGVWRENLDFSDVDISENVSTLYSGSNPNPEYPIVTDATGDNSYRYASDFYVEDGSYVRLKNVQLGYNVPKETLNRLRMQSLRIYVSGQNLITITDYEGFDPEVGTSSATAGGIDRGSYPQGRLYMIGLDLTF